MGLAGVLIAGLLAIIGILLKVLLSRVTETQNQVTDTKAAVEPISNGFASETSEKLDTLAERQGDICQELKAQGRTLKSQGNEIRNLQAADDTLLEMIADVRSHQT